MSSEALQPWLPFVGSLVALLVAHRLATQVLITLFFRLVHNRTVAMLGYALLVWPGTVLHEWAHWLAARLLGVRANLPHLLPSGLDEKGGMVLGHVMVERVDPLRHSLIGAAPLVAGSVVVAFLARHAFALSLPDLEREGWRSLPLLLEALPGIFSVADAWVYLYGLFAIANAMLPSPSDRTAWPAVLGFTTLLALAFVFVLGVPEIPSAFTTFALRLAAWLTLAFTLTAVLDFLLLLVLLPLERLLWVMGR